MGMAGDQHWTVDPNWPASRASNCTGDCHARFLLAVEEGVMLGAEGWDEAYDKPRVVRRVTAPATATSLIGIHTHQRRRALHDDTRENFVK